MFQSVRFEVVGEQRLHCESCEGRVERLLKGLPGVGKVRADARRQRIEVLVDTAVLEPDLIVKRLGEAGYQTRIAS